HIPTTKLTFIVIASTAIFTLSLHDALPIFSPTDSVAQITQSLDLSGLRECSLQFFLHLDTPEHSDDRLVIEQKLPPPYNRWTELVSFYGDAQGEQRLSVPEYWGPDYHLRFRFV